MAHGRRVEQWNHTSSLQAHLVNINRGKGTSPSHPETFHPYATKRSKRTSIRDFQAAIAPGTQAVSISVSAFESK